MTGLTRTLALGGGGLLLAALALGVPRVSPEQGSVGARVVAPQLDGFPTNQLGVSMDLLFLHHEAGALLLAESIAGPEGPIPGGALRSRLEAAGYRVHTATFGSRFGEHNYLFDWLPKFRDHLPEILRIEDQDRVLPAGRGNRIVVFKSCRVNTLFIREGSPPGNAVGPELSLENAKATFRALAEVFSRHPEVLFVYVTSPPFAPPAPERLGGVLWKRVVGKQTFGDQAVASARLNRRFHDWVVSPGGWLNGKPLKNVVVFDYYDFLTKESSSLFLAYHGEGMDRDAVSSEANREVARRMVPFLNQAVRRAGLVE